MTKLSHEGYPVNLWFDGHPFGSILPEARTKSTLLGPLEFLIGSTGWDFFQKKLRSLFPGMFVQVGWLFGFVVQSYLFFFVFGKLEPEITNLQNDSSQFSQEQEEQRAKVRYTMNLPKCEGPPRGDTWQFGPLGSMKMYGNLNLGEKTGLSIESWLFL